MIKQVTVMLLCILVFSTARAQSDDKPVPNSQETSNQDQTQIKYGLTAIAELQLYLGWLIKGYEIARDGLNTIHSIKTGEFNLHDVFYTSLQKVSPKVKGFSEIAATIANENYCIGQAKKFTKPGANSNLSVTDQKAIANTSSVVIDDCNRVLGELGDVTTSGKLEMTDAERLKRIHMLYSYSVAQCAFVKQYQSQTATYNAQRSSDSKAQQELESLYLK